MFCYGIENVEYYLFNKPVDKKRFELFRKQYKQYMTQDLSFSQDWPDNLLIAYRVIIVSRFDDWYKKLPAKFWKWARTLPNFDSMIIYMMTMFPEFLE